SDVCSSDLHASSSRRAGPVPRAGPRGRGVVRVCVGDLMSGQPVLRASAGPQNCRAQLLSRPVSHQALSLTRSFQVPFAVSEEASTVYVVLMLSELPPVP